MGEPGPIRYRTGWLWIVLTVLLLFGTVAAATVVYGITSLLGHGSLPVAAGAMALGSLGALLAFLLLAGLLYRVDRLRGVPHRTVRLFE